MKNKVLKYYRDYGFFYAEEHIDEILAEYNNDAKLLLTMIENCVKDYRMNYVYEFGKHGIDWRSPETGVYTM